MRNKLSKILISGVILCSTALMGAQKCPSVCDPKPEPCKKVVPCDPCKPCKPCCTEMPSTTCPTIAAYNAPARVDVACGLDAYVSLSFLYWEAIEKGTDVGLRISHTVTPTAQSAKRDILKMDFEYDPAFKIGVGFSSDRDDWSLYLEYIRFYSTASKGYFMDLANTNQNNHLSNNFLDILHLHAPVYYHDVKGTWKLEMDIVDFEISRPYYLGQKIMFKPHVGFRAGSIDQKYFASGKYTSNDNIITTNAKDKSDSWLLGPRIGLDTNWVIGKGFGFFANAATALFYQDYDIDIYIYEDIQPGVTTSLQFTSDYSMGTITPNLELALGFDYKTYCSNNRYHVTFSAGYEFHMLWNQNQIRHVKDSIDYPSSLNIDDGDLVLHGLTLMLRFDF